jgi:hypothetical protein
MSGSSARSRAPRSAIPSNSQSDVREQPGSQEGARGTHRRQRHGEPDAAGSGSRHRQAARHQSPYRRHWRSKCNRRGQIRRRHGAENRGRYFFGQDQNQLEQIYATLDRINAGESQDADLAPSARAVLLPAGCGPDALIRVRGSDVADDTYRRPTKAPATAAGATALIRWHRLRPRRRPLNANGRRSCKTRRYLPLRSDLSRSCGASIRRKIPRSVRHDARP